MNDASVSSIGKSFQDVFAYDCRIDSTGSRNPRGKDATAEQQLCRQKVVSLIPAISLPLSTPTVGLE